MVAQDHRVNQGLTDNLVVRDNPGTEGQLGNQGRPGHKDKLAIEEE